MRADRKKIGQILVERGLIDTVQLNSAMGHQKRWGKKLGETLVELGLLKESDLASVLGDVFSLPVLDIDKVKFDPKALAMVEGAFCRAHHLIPIAVRKFSGKTKLAVACADPSEFEALDELGFKSGLPIVSAIATLSAVDRAIARHYFGTGPDRKEITITRTVHPEDEEMEVIRDGAQEILHFSEKDNVGVREPDRQKLTVAKRFFLLVKLLADKSLITPEEEKKLLDRLDF